MSDANAMIRRLSELQATQASDQTLRNLIDVLRDILDLGARIPMMVFEAQQEGNDDVASLFRSLLTSQNRDKAAVLDAVKALVDTREHAMPAVSAVGARTTA
jgi:hypothetical protein